MGHQIHGLGSALIGEEARSIGGNLSVIPTLEKNPVSLGYRVILTNPKPPQRMIIRLKDADSHEGTAGCGIDLNIRC